MSMLATILNLTYNKSSAEHLREQQTGMMKAFSFFSKIVLKKSVLSLYLLLLKSQYHYDQTQYERTFKKLPTSSGLVKFSNHSVIFNLEGALLKSSSYFPYFMLVAFEAGGVLRALVLLLFYPLIWLVGEKRGTKIMVFVSFAGIKKDRFRLGTSVLHKFLLEDVGNEGFDVMMRCRRKVGVTEFPRIMVEGFLKDYMGVDGVIGRELKVLNGYFVGIMEAKTTGRNVVNEVLGDEIMSCNVICIDGSNKSIDQQLFSSCKEIYMVTEAEKRSWQTLPRKRYPKPLIFHDGRLAFRPTPLETLLMFMWLPLGFLAFTFRLITPILLPYKASLPALAMFGLRITISTTTTTITKHNPNNILYVCNHRTLLDPICLSLCLMNSLTAVTYSLSRFNELISPIRTVRLVRDREKDKMTMEKMLSQGDLVVCPEGTTCREPYLLRFSPLFAEMTDEIVPAALDMQVTMFHGSTASGLKCLDPAFYLMNPHPVYSIKILNKLPASHTCKSGGKTRFEVANHVQKEIANALGFQCTNLTRKDKYMVLAGNNGII